MPAALPASRAIAFPEVPDSPAPRLNGQLTSQIFAASHNARIDFCCFPGSAGGGGEAENAPEGVC